MILISHVGSATDTCNSVGMVSYSVAGTSTGAVSAGDTSSDVDSFDIESPEDLFDGVGSVGEFDGAA